MVEPARLVTGAVSEIKLWASHNVPSFVLINNWGLLASRSGSGDDPGCALVAQCGRSDREPTMLFCLCGSC